MKALEDLILPQKDDLSKQFLILNKNYHHLLCEKQWFA